MAVGAKLKYYCCTLSGLLRLKLIVSIVVGLVVMIGSILSLLNIVAALVDPLGILRSAWNALFGFLILIAQPGWQRIPLCNKLLGRWIERFGFLNKWLGRGLFYLLCAGGAIRRTPAQF